MLRHYSGTKAGGWMGHYREFNDLSYFGGKIKNDTFCFFAYYHFLHLVIEIFLYDQNLYFISLFFLFWLWVSLVYYCLQGACTALFRFIQTAHSEKFRFSGHERSYTIWIFGYYTDSPIEKQKPPPPPPLPTELKQ